MFELYHQTISRCYNFSIAGQPFIPTIWSNVIGVSQHERITSNLLLKIRIIQVIIGYKTYSGKCIVVNDIVKIIEQVYGYVEHNIRTHINLMFIERLINLETEYFESFTDFGEYRAEVTSLGEIVYDKLQYSPEYWESNMFYSVLPKGILDSFEFVSIKSVKPAMDFDNFEDMRRGKAMSINEYIPRITNNLRKFIALIWVIESWEVTRVKRWLRYSKFDDSLSGFMTEYCNNYHKNTSEQMYRSFRKRVKKNYNSLQRNANKSAKIKYTDYFDTDWNENEYNLTLK